MPMMDPIQMVDTCGQPMHNGTILIMHRTIAFEEKSDFLLFVLIACPCLWWTPYLK